MLFLFSYHRFHFPWYVPSSANGEPHHSGLKSQIVALSLWCVMFLVLLLLILDLGTRWGWVVSVKPRPRFSPSERTPGTHWIGGWMGLRIGLDIEARRKLFASDGNQISVVQSVETEISLRSELYPDRVRGPPSMLYNGPGSSSF
jgi:hypothetical protein